MIPQSRVSSVLFPALFVLGLLPAIWIGAGYLGHHALGIAVVAVIAGCYLIGAVELHHYRRGTAALARALADTGAAAGDLAAWLQPLPPALRQPVRMRIEHERAALPAPALTPYLVGMLVLLGMLGTLLGMMATLRGTGLALETATSLEAIRGSLAAPVQGLGFTFGTSIVGVASSAMLGLLSALCRRERLQAVQALDVAIAGPLRVHSQAHQREQTFLLLQQQAGLLPTLVERLEAMTATLARQGELQAERQATRQQEFHARTEAANAQLAAVLQQSLQAGVEQHTRAVGAALQPAMEATLAGLAKETRALQDSVGQAVQRQLEGLASGFASASAAAADSWQAALAAQQRSQQAQAEDLRGALEAFTGEHARRSGELIDSLAGRLDQQATQLAEQWRSAMAEQQAAHAAAAERHAQAQDGAAARFGAYAAELVQAVEQAQARWQQDVAAQEAERQAAWTAQLRETGSALREDWQQAGAHTAQLQQQICEALAGTARDITAQAQAHASDTLAEISRLVQTASEAPRAAAEVIAELRQKLSDSLQHDTALVAERNQLLATLQTLLDAVNHASQEQRGAIDALVATSADVLERVGNRFTDHIETETGKLGDIAAQVAVGASEVASLGESLGAAVQLFGQSNAGLLERLQGIEGALDKSLARSDEQLAYYVAQAREVIDLSLLSQRQILAELQQIGGSAAVAEAGAA